MIFALKRKVISLIMIKFERNFVYFYSIEFGFRLFHILLIIHQLLNWILKVKTMKIWLIIILLLSVVKRYENVIFSFFEFETNNNMIKNIDSMQDYYLYLNILLPNIVLNGLLLYRYSSGDNKTIYKRRFGLFQNHCCFRLSRIHANWIRISGK